MNAPESAPEPSWLVAAIDQRLALIKEQVDPTLLRLAKHELMMTQLTEPDDTASAEQRQRWERTCDNCGAYCPDPTPFFTGSALRRWQGIQIVMAFGCCKNCKEKK